ncbi:MAG: hypothetical protein U0797_10325 [Gemmataceae bacterium]
MFDRPADRSKNWIARAFGVVMVAGGAALLLYHKDMFRQAAEGAAPVTPAQLAAAAGPGDLPRAWVVFSPDQIVTPNITQVEGVKVKRQVYYHLVRVGDRWGVLRSADRTLMGRVTATATEADYQAGEDGVARAISEALRPRSRGRLLSYSFDNVSNPSSEVAIYGSVVFVLLVFGAMIACGLFDASPEAELDEGGAGSGAYWAATAAGQRW